MVKILYLARFLNTVSGGGSSVSLNQMATQMVNQGHDVDVFITDVLNIEFDPNYNILDYTQQIGNLRQSKIFIDLRSKIADISDEYDLLHIFSPTLLPIIGSNINEISCPTVGRLNTYPLFCTNLRKMDGKCHSNCSLIKKFNHDTGSFKSKMSNLPRYFSKTYLEPKWTYNIENFFAISPSVRKIYMDYGIEKNKIDIVPNMMEYIEERSTLQHTINEHKADLNLLYLGRLVPEKGVDLLINAINNMDSKRIHLNIVGDGRELEELAGSVTESSSGAITFHGRIPHSEIGAYFSQADLFVHPHTWPEPFGRVILESLQYECPVLSANIGAPPWISGNAGYEFEARNSDDLREQIRYAINNPKDIKNMSEQTIAETQRFSKDQIIPLIESKYNKIIG